MLIEITAGRYVRRDAIVEVRDYVALCDGVPVRGCDVYLERGGVLSLKGRAAESVVKRINEATAVAPASDKQASKGVKDLKASGLAGVVNNVEAVVKGFGIPIGPSVPLDELDAPIDLGGIRLKPSEILAVMQHVDQDGLTTVTLTAGAAQVRLSATQVFYRLALRLTSALRAR